MKGQALISLLFFAVIATTVTTAGLIMIDLNAISGTKFQQGELAYQTAQSGAENATLRLLRDSSYTGESSLVIGTGTANIAVSGSGTAIDPYIIISTGTVGNFVRKVQITATYINNQFVIVSQQENF